MMFARNSTPAKITAVQAALRIQLLSPERPGNGGGIPIGAATVRERLPRRNRAPRPEAIPLATTGSSPIEKGQPLPAALLPPTFLRNTSVPVHYRPQRRSEALRFLLHARRQRLCGLVSGGGAQIQKRLAGLEAQQRHDGLRPDVLYARGFQVHIGLRHPQVGACDGRRSLRTVLPFPTLQQPGRVRKVDGGTGPGYRIAIHLRSEERR